MTWRITSGDSRAFQRALAAARPGDTILLAPGEYRAPFQFPPTPGVTVRPE